MGKSQVTVGETVASSGNYRAEGSCHRSGPGRDTEISSHLFQGLKQDHITSHTPVPRRKLSALSKSILRFH